MFHLLFNEYLTLAHITLRIVCFVNNLTSTEMYIPAEKILLYALTERSREKQEIMNKKKMTMLNDKRHETIFKPSNLTTSNEN